MVILSMRTHLPDFQFYYVDEQENLFFRGNQSNGWSWVCKKIIKRPRRCKINGLGKERILVMELQEKMMVERIKDVARNMQFSLNNGEKLTVTGEGFKGFHIGTSEMVDSIIKGKEEKVLNFLQDNQKAARLADAGFGDTCVFCGQDRDDKNYYVYISFYKEVTATDYYDDEDAPKELIKDFVEMFKGNTHRKKEENAKRFTKDLSDGAFILLVQQCCNSWELGVH
jgi:hypothetical protein